MCCGLRACPRRAVRASRGTLRMRGVGAGSVSHRRVHTIPTRTGPRRRALSPRRRGRPRRAKTAAGATNTNRNLTTWRRILSRIESSVRRRGARGSPARCARSAVCHSPWWMRWSSGKARRCASPRMPPPRHTPLHAARRQPPAVTSMFIRSSHPHTPSTAAALVRGASTRAVRDIAQGPRWLHRAGDDDSAACSPPLV